MIGPSSTKDAITPRVRPAKNLVVFQWPFGTARVLTSAPGVTTRHNGPLRFNLISTRSSRCDLGSVSRCYPRARRHLASTRDAFLNSRV